MNLYFATCDRSRALCFLRKLYPAKPISDTPESAKALLDLVEADLIRIPDPDFHPGTVIPGKKWDESRRGEAFDVCEAFHNRVSALPAQEAADGR